MDRTIDEILADAQRIASEPLSGEPMIAARHVSASSVAAAHLRAESEGRPVTCNNVTVFPIGARPKEV